jgi:hypothetical protein
MPKEALEPALLVAAVANLSARVWSQEKPAGTIASIHPGEPGNASLTGCGTTGVSPVGTETRREFDRRDACRTSN